jgi:hypothetical protein
MNDEVFITCAVTERESVFLAWNESRAESRERLKQAHSAIERRREHGPDGESIPRARLRVGCAVRGAPG